MSGSVWVVALALPCLTATTVTAVRAEAVVLRHRAEGVADRAALAGADAAALQGPDQACRAAGRISAADRAQVVSCSVDGQRVRLVVRVAGWLPVAGAVSVSVAAAAVPGGPARIPLPMVPP